jgi:hypothetical protein
MVTTRRCSVISRTVLVLGTATSIPDCRTGAEIMKMTSPVLVEGFGLGAVDEALEDDGTVSDSVDCAGRNGEVIAGRDRAW